MFFWTCSATQKYRISIALDCYFLTVLFTMPTAVVLSKMIGVAGWLCPSSLRVSQYFFASFTLRNRLLSSGSAADAATCFNMVLMVWIAPLRKMGLLSSSFFPENNIPLV
eukprot:2820755-Ditylum_brightwellii.AAC.1